MIKAAIKNKLKIIILFLLLFAFSACKKLIEVDAPTTSVNSKNIFDKDVTAASVLTGIYTNLSSAGIQSGGLTSMSYLASLSSDELSRYGELFGIENMYFTNTLDGQTGGYEFWNNIYPVIYVLNASLEGLNESKTLTPAVKQQLIGEAKFMRAFCFFYLVNLYGNVPLVITTDYKVNSTMPRTDKDQVWGQIIADLKDAEALLNSGYLDATLLKITEERVRPNKMVATALLSRVYLYRKEWQKAEEQATLVLNNPTYSLVNLQQVFKRNSKEAIWQLQPVTKGYNAPEALTFIIDPVNGFRSPVYLSQRLLSCFDIGDLRKINWIGNSLVGGVNYSYAYKYKALPSAPDVASSEYPTIFRLGEQYLIRAEARIQQNKISDGINDLNTLRNRATDKTVPPESQLKLLSNDLSKEKALLAVEKERRTELFTEWGHRWLDLKRTDRIDEVMTKEVPLKIAGGFWKTYKQWYPLPKSDLINNPKLTQNVGY